MIYIPQNAILIIKPLDFSSLAFSIGFGRVDFDVGNVASRLLFRIQDPKDLEFGV